MSQGNFFPAEEEPEGLSVVSFDSVDVPFVEYNVTSRQDAAFKKVISESRFLLEGVYRRLNLLDDVSRFVYIARLMDGIGCANITS